MDKMQNSDEDFFTQTYPRIWHEAYAQGVNAKLNGLPRDCNLIDIQFLTPSGNKLKVYKSAWEQGWDGDKNGISRWDLL